MLLSLLEHFLLELIGHAHFLPIHSDLSLGAGFRGRRKSDGGSHSFGDGAVGSGDCESDHVADFVGREGVVDRKDPVASPSKVGDVGSDL